ncbi:pre-toxin TG domain-containing protein [Streptomyces yokosukanensis]|uniref:pre-toxin TG domain-containing protein n=1 Tax=Streptomyces yokosukanensis TaxID=67386 RepID=UPI00343D0540
MAVQAKPEVRWGLVAEALTCYKHAVLLARGIDAAEQAQLEQDPGKLRERESRATVPREDVEAAYQIATEVRRLFVEWQERYYTVPWPGLVELGVRVTMNSASAATKHLVEETRRILDGSPPGAGQVRSLYGAWPLIWVQWLYAAYDPLRIIEGELPLSETAIGQVGELFNDVTDFVLTMIPAVGEWVLAYEAGTGHQFAGGRKLSPVERVLAAFGLVLPAAIGALVKEAPRVGVVLRNFRVNLARSIPGSAASRLDRFTADMVIGLRALPKESFDKFLRIIRITKALSADQEKAVNFYLSRIDYASRLAQWMRIIEKKFGTGLTGVHALERPPNLVVGPHEQAMMEELSRLSNKPVVSVPEMHPRDYDDFVRKLAADPQTKMPQVKGVKYADTVWGSEFAELYQVQEAKAGENVLDAIKKRGKGKQASTLVVQNGPGMTHDLPSLFDNRFWCKPDFQWINKIVVIEANALKVIERPVRYITMDPQVYALTRLLTGNPAHLIKTVEEVDQAEEEAKKRADAQR